MFLVKKNVCFFLLFDKCLVLSKTISGKFKSGGKVACCVFMIIDTSQSIVICYV